MNIDKKMKRTEDNLKRVVASLEKVDDGAKAVVVEIVDSMDNTEIIQLFNQTAFDMFDTILEITIRMGIESEYKIKGYQHLFQQAIGINFQSPIDRFALLVLEFAHEIYAGNEDCFLNMSLTDTKISINNEFSLIRSAAFQKLWLMLGQSDKDAVKDIVILLTTYSHAYLYKTISK